MEAEESEHQGSYSVKMLAWGLRYTAPSQNNKNNNKDNNNK